jgi:hypothetical protein
MGEKQPENIPCYDEGMKRVLPESTHSSDSFHGAEFVSIIKQFHKNKCPIIDEMQIVLEIKSEGDKIKGHVLHCRYLQRYVNGLCKSTKKTAFLHTCRSVPT